MKRLALVTLATGCLMFGVTACQIGGDDNSTSVDASHAANGDKRADQDRDKANKRAALEREAPIAREKLARARRELEDAQTDHAAAIEKIKRESDLAAAKFETFDQREAPQRLAKARLDLQGARDSVADSTEELEQLEMMYKEQDLADKTKEIVIRRAKRQLERANARLALQEKDARTLEERSLAHERERLTIDLEEKKRELERAARAGERALMEKRIAVMSAEAEVARVDRELASAGAAGPPK